LVDELTSLNLTVDKIYCLEVIEHIYKDQARTMFESFYYLLKPGGKIFITTPNYRSLWPVIEWLIDRFKFAPKMHNEQHVELYNKKNL